MNNRQENDVGRKYGYVYVATCTAICYLKDDGKTCCPVKIGKTNDYDDRMAQFNSAVPIDFVIHRLLRVPLESMQDLESRIHAALKDFRIRGEKTEFFTCDLKEAMNVSLRELQILAKKEKWKRGLDYQKEDNLLQYGRSASSKRKLREEIESGKVKFKYASKDVIAFGRHHGKAFILLAGSQIQKIASPKFEASKPTSYREHWLDVVQNRLDRHGLLKEDYPCSCPSEAATIVCASRRNGNGWARVENETETIGKYRGKR